MSTPDTGMAGIVERLEAARTNPYGRHARPLTHAELDAIVGKEVLRPRLRLRTAPYPAYSELVAGRRSGISSLEMAVLAEALEASVVELLTGEPDPHAVVLTAGRGVIR